MHTLPLTRFNSFLNPHMRKFDYEKHLVVPLTLITSGIHCKIYSWGKVRNDYRRVSYNHGPLYCNLVLTEFCQ